MKGHLPSLSPALCLLFLILSLQKPGCESSRFLGAAAAKYILSDSPVAKHTRRQCAAKSELQVVNHHDQVQSLTPTLPVRLSIPQLNCRSRYPMLLLSIMQTIFDVKMGSQLVW